MRLSKPLDLAEYLLADAPGWTRAAIEAAVASGATRRVNLAGAIPVHFTYFTAWVEEGGTVQFRDDIYGRDESFFAALIDQLIIHSAVPEPTR